MGKSKLFVFVLVVFLISSISAITSFDKVEQISYFDYQHSNPNGIYYDEENGYLWITDLIDGAIYRYFVNGTYSDFSIDTSLEGNENPSSVGIFKPYSNLPPMLITTDLIDTKKLFSYFTNGTLYNKLIRTNDTSYLIKYSDTEMINGYGKDLELIYLPSLQYFYPFNISDSDISHITGGVRTLNFLYLTDYSGGKIYEFEVFNKTLIERGSFDVDFPYGVASNKRGDLLWVTDVPSKKIKHYKFTKKDSCGFVNNYSNGVYTLNNSIVETKLNSACFRPESNTVFDCNGHWINFTGTIVFNVVHENLNNVTIKNCNIHSSINGIMVRNLNGTAENIFIYNNTILSDRNALTTYYLKDSSIFNNIIHSGENGIDIQGRNVSVYNNKVTSNYDGIIAWYLIDSKINKNIIDTNVSGIYLYSSEGVNISDNVISSNLDNSIYLGNSQSIRVHNNTLSSGAGGVFAECLIDLNISKNKIDSFWTGIHIPYLDIGESGDCWSDIFNIFENKINSSNTAIDVGIGSFGLVNVSHNDIFSKNGASFLYPTLIFTNNKIISNNKGVEVLESDLLRFHGNNITSNYDYGIYIFDSVGNMTDNYVQTLNYSSIFLEEVDNIYIKNLRVNSSNTPIIFSNSNNNQIYESRLIGGNGVYLENSINNSFISCVYSDESLGDSDLYRKWYYDAYIAFSNGTLVKGANVSVYNAFGDFVFSKLTDSDGGIPTQELIEYFNDGDEIVEYYPYDAYVRYGGLTYTYEFDLTDDLTTFFRIPSVPVSINIVSPTPYQSYNYKDNIPFGVFEYADKPLSNCWYSKNGVNITYTCGNNFTVSEAGSGTYKLTVWANDTLNNLGKAEVNYVVSLSSPSITINYPQNGIGTNINLGFNVTATDSDGIKNCSLWSNFTGTWGLDQTSSSVISGLTYNFKKNLSDGTYLFNFECFDNNGAHSFGASNFTFTLDTTTPSAKINDVQTTAGTKVLKFSSTESDNNLHLCKYSILNSLGQVDGISNNVSYSCNANPHYAATWGDYGEYTLYIFIEDIAGNLKSDSLLFITSEVKGNTFTPGGGGGGGGGASLEDILEGLGYCGDKICQDGTNDTLDRGEDFYTCPTDCSKINSIFTFDTLNLETLFLNCFSKDDELKERCFWKKRPGLLFLLIVIIVIFVFSIFFSLKPSGGGKKTKIVYNFKRRRR